MNLDHYPSATMNRIVRLFQVCILFFELLTVCAFASTRHTISYPIDGAKNVRSETTVGVTYEHPLTEPSLAVAAVTAVGNIDGAYSGTLTLSLDRKTLIFKPNHPFRFNESVTVTIGQLQAADGSLTEPVTLSFTTRSPINASSKVAFHSDDPMLEAVLYHGKLDQGNFTKPEHAAATPLGFPLLTVFNDDAPTIGNMYVANFKFALSQDGTYKMILDNNGNIVFAQSNASALALDFKPETNGTYTYWDGRTIQMYVMDQNFQIIDSMRPAHGYSTDAHELRYMPDGSYYLIGLDSIQMDMRPYLSGADSNAIVLDDIVQEFDKNKNLIFEWRGLDHYKLTDIENESLGGPLVDYCHMNAIEIDSDGNLLFSCRHMDEITKVDRQTGDIIWRMGGKNNQFTFYGDTIGFSHQHAIRRTTAGTYTFFDNGNYHVHGGTFSRAVEFKLDQTNKTAGLVWEFRHQPLVYGQAMGYVQRLDNGNTLIGWGACDNLSVTEVGPFNRTVFELEMDSANYSYRAFKFPANYFNAVEQPSTPVAPVGSISVYPNPISNIGNAEFTLSTSGNITAVLYNMLGVAVRHVFSGELASGGHSISVDCHDLTSGMYQLRLLQSDGSALTAKVVVQ